VLVVVYAVWPLFPLVTISRSSVSRSSKAWVSLWQRTISLFVTITLLLLPYNWTFQPLSHEIEVLTIARQLADPSWLPQDWYLSQAANHPGLFEWMTSGLTGLIGGVGTIIVGRLLCYGLLALGLALITRQLDLRPGASLLAISLWLGFSRLVPIESASQVYFGFAGVTIASLLLVCTGRFPNLKRHYLKLFLLAYGLLLAANDPQSVITDEFLIPDFEAKSIAYGCVIIAIGLFLRDRRYLTALLAGVSTSFSPIIGAYGFLVILICWFLEDVFLGTLRTKATWKVFVPFAIGAIAVLPELWQNISATPPITDVLASEITVFFRFPDHLNPETWYTAGWLKLATYLIVLALSVYMIAVTQRRAALEIDRSFAKRRALLFVLVCAIPFAFGLLVAPTNDTGSLLQYFPFSLFNTLLPLFTLLFFVRALQSIGTLGLTFTGIDGLCWLLVVPIVLRTSIDLVPFLGNPAAGLTSGLPPAERDLYAWIQAETPQDATIVAPPNFRGVQLLAERGTVATFDFFPQTESGVIDWLTRLDDLTAGGAQRELAAIGSETPRRIAQIRSNLMAAYQQLDPDQATAIMERYDAACFVTTAPANFQRAAERAADYENPAYAVYCRDAALPKN
jgi:hypothetical protein